MCLLFIYSPIVQTKKKLTFCLCATMIMLCQMKNEHSWSKPLAVRYFGLVCFRNKTRTGLRTSCFLQSRGMIPILNNCCESTIRRHWIAERSYSQWSIVKILGLNIWKVNLKTCIQNWIFVAINIKLKFHAVLSNSYMSFFSSSHL